MVYLFTVGLGGGLAYMSAFIFDTTISLSLNSTAYALSFLSSGWTTARDLANMAFILILVYIAFMIMFQAETAGTIKMLAGVIFIALIINFSFFFTRVVIDIGNILAVQFYNSAGVGADGKVHTLAEAFSTAASSGSATSVAALGATSVANYFGNESTLKNTRDLTYNIMSALNITQLFSNESFKASVAANGTMSNLIILSTLYIAIGAAYFILAAMFLAVGVKFLVRIVVLWFLIIASPLAFVCKAMPDKTGVSGWYDRWQHELVSHAFYPAFFLFIFFFISTVMAGLNTSNGLLGGLATDLKNMSQNQDISGVLFIMSAIANVGIRLGFVVAMLYIALKASETMGVRGAAAANKLTTFAFGSAGKLASAPIGFAGRRVLGGGIGTVYNKSAERYKQKAALSTSPVLQKSYLQAAQKHEAIAKKLGSYSYDPRNAPGASVLKKVAEKVTGPTINAGKPPEGGYMAQAKVRADRIKQEQAARSLILREAENKKLITDLAEKSDKHDKLETESKTRTLTPAEETEKRALKNDVENMASKFNSLSKREVESFKLAEIEKVLKHANENVIKKVEESDKHTDKQKEEVREKWNDKMGEKALENSQEIIRELKEIHKDLTTRGGIATGTLKAFEHATTSTNLIDSTAIKNLNNEIKAGMAASRALANTAATAAEKTKHELTFQNLQEARDNVAKLNKEREKVPASKGGTPNAKEFLVA